jgi:hypothetical protein
MCCNKSNFFLISIASASSNTWTQANITQLLMSVWAGSSGTRKTWGTVSLSTPTLAQDDPAQGVLLQNLRAWLSTMYHWCMFRCIWTLIRNKRMHAHVCLCVCVCFCVYFCACLYADANVGVPKVVTPCAEASTHTSACAPQRWWSTVIAPRLCALNAWIHVNNWSSACWEECRQCYQLQESVVLVHLFPRAHINVLACINVWDQS